MRRWRQSSAATCEPLQAEHGGWPLYLGGDFNISCSIKSYYALKLAGDESGLAAHGPRAHPPYCSMAAPPAMSSPGLRWPCSRCRGAACPTCRSKSCCCRDGFHSISTMSLLVADRHRAAFGAVHAQTGRPKPTPDPHRRIVPGPPRRGARLYRAQGLHRRLFFRVRSPGSAGRSLDSREHAQTSDRAWRIVDDERLNGEDGRRRNFPAMVNSVLDAMSGPGCSAEDPRARHRETGACKSCWWSKRKTAPLPALRLAGMGYQRSRPSPCRRRETLRHRTHRCELSDWLKERQLLDEPADWQG